jgi:hypothetical protein
MDGCRRQVPAGAEARRDQLRQCDYHRGVASRATVATDRYWDGVLDEARVMTSARSFDWAKLVDSAPMQTAVAYGATLER